MLDLLLRYKSIVVSAVENIFFFDDLFVCVSVLCSVVVENKGHSGAQKQHRHSVQPNKQLFSFISRCPSWPNRATATAAGPQQK